MIENIIDASMTETFKLEKQSKMLIQKVIFGVASFKDEKYEGIKYIFILWSGLSHQSTLLPDLSREPTKIWTTFKLKERYHKTL